MRLAGMSVAERILFDVGAASAMFTLVAVAGWVIALATSLPT
jgi:hypothetical protein